jgi:hypothetical protein
VTLSARIMLALVVFTAPVGAQRVRTENVLPDKPAPRVNFFTRPFYDKPVAGLAMIQGGAVTWDFVTTRMMIARGGYENNPIMRPFVHNSGTFAAETVVQVWFSAFIADRMKHSRSPVLRKTWWLPQVVNISSGLSGGIYNTSMLGRCTPTCQR